MGKKNIKKTLADETSQLVHQITKRKIGGIIGGFPCQDISFAGAGKGIQGGGSALLAATRSGLFWELVKTYLLVRPRYWLMENVAALLTRGMGTVLGAVATCGCDAEWDCVGAGTVGAPHHRARIYILAYPSSERGERKFPQTIQRQPEFSWCKDIRSTEDLRERPPISEPLICGTSNGLRRRLHGIGNGNPPCVIREITRGLK